MDQSSTLGKRRSRRPAGSSGTADADPGAAGGGEESALKASKGPEPATDIPIGIVDAATAEEIAGWAWDPGHPKQPIAVEILDGDNVLVTVDADIYRPDLERAGIGDGRHGFKVHRIGALLPRIVHQLRIRRSADKRELNGSPRWIINPGGELDGDGRRQIEDLATAAIKTISEPEKLEDVLSLFVDCSRRLLERQKSLLASVPDAPESAAATVQAIREQYPDLPLPASEAPKVSVIIPAYNNFRMTYECLESIAANPPETSFELILVDDGSTDETALAGLLLPESVVIERQKTNNGFIAACNRGAQIARGEYLLFLNNDTLVQPGWLDELAWTFKRTDNVGIVGSQLLSEDGKVQDTGGIVWRLGDAWNWGRDADPEDPRFRHMRDADYVSGAALMIRKDLFLALGGFDAYYAPAYYEDTDLAFRVRDAGKRVVVQPASRIVHREGSTSGTDTAGPGVKRYQTVNQAKFYRRWRSRLLHHRINGEEPSKEAERSVVRRAYFIDNCAPTPDIDAGSNVAVQHMLALIALGYKVTFIAADNMARHDPYTANLERYGIECPHSPFCLSTEQLFREHRTAPDLIFIHRFDNAEKYAGMARIYFPKATIVYSVADLHFLRLDREASVTGRREAGLESQLMKGRELAAMQRADVVISHSPYEVDLLKHIAPGIKARVLGWAVPLRKLKTPVERRSGIAFVGGYQHRPNVDAALHLVSELMPLIRAAGLPIRCYLGGSRMPPEISELRDADVEIVGFVPDLAGLFEQVRCTVAPLRYGAGVKGKVLDSLAFGLPCVMTEIAAEGLELPADLAWLVARGPEEFAEKVVALHRDNDLANSLREAGQAFIRDRFAFDVIRDELQQIIRSARPSNAANA